MKISELFRPRRAVSGAGQAATPPPVEPAPPAVEGASPLSPEELRDIQDAWAELTQAAKDAGVTNFHACGRGGQHWSESASSIRSLAALLRNMPRDDAADD